MKSLVAKENTVVIIEHNLDIIKYADWIIVLVRRRQKGRRADISGLPEEIVNYPRRLRGSI
jgi:excinuclease ABC subunit A